MMFGVERELRCQPEYKSRTGGFFVPVDRRRSCRLRQPGNEPNRTRTTRASLCPRAQRKGRSPSVGPSREYLYGPNYVRNCTIQAMTKTSMCGKIRTLSEPVAAMCHVLFLTICSTVLRAPFVHSSLSYEGWVGLKPASRAALPPVRHRRYPAVP
jgi:hypothetical protein